MNTFSVQPGLVVLWNRWLWVVERQINDCWRVRRIGDNQVALLSPGQWSETANSGNLFVLSSRKNAYLETLTCAEVARLVSALPTPTNTIDGGAKWISCTSKRGW